MKVGRSIGLAALTAIGIDLLIFLLHSNILSFLSESDAPWTFWTIWVVGALVGLGWLFFDKYKFDWGPIVVASVIASVLSGIVWESVPDEAVQSIGAPRYLGIRYTCGHGGAMRLGDAIDLQRDSMMESRDSYCAGGLSVCAGDCEVVQFSNFFTSQAGLAVGYGSFSRRDPDYEGVLDRLVLFASVGPVVILECILWGLFLRFPLLLLFELVYVVAKRKSIWTQEVET